MLLGDSDGVKYKLYANPTAWWNEDIHVVWLETPFGSLQRPRQPAILIVDDFSGHWTPLTYLRGEWVQLLRQQLREHTSSTHAFTFRAPTRANVCEWVCSSWEKLSATTIKNGFKRDHF
ncbi:hypothetical protein GN244_ATG13244 [Phytophthora infestans]|uniref:DDE-1 domain-containing protein n=1 Tax=Phytophthora infestans TaxID=4787 RepID=A0A833WHD7_PHYIN|nr:hypothetical protein GN244_ATG13244 [Phytophthora infestans]